MAEKPSDKVGDKYVMDRNNRGYAVIINNREFDESTELSERDGTDCDAEKVFSLLKELGFPESNIISHVNLPVKEMRQSIIDVSKMDFSDSDCLICVILTHGSEAGKIWATDEEVELSQLLVPLKGKNCPSLIEKPKIVFIQACQGMEIDVVSHSDAWDEPDEEETNHLPEYVLPSEADFLMAYSTVPGQLSWRTNEGSWFIQALCDVVSSEWRQDDLLSMMTKVNKKVAYNCVHANHLKQMPCVQTMLTRKVFF